MSKLHASWTWNLNLESGSHGVPTLGQSPWWGTCSHSKMSASVYLGWGTYSQIQCRHTPVRASRTARLPVLQLGAWKLWESHGLSGPQLHCRESGNPGMVGLTQRQKTWTPKQPTRQAGRGFPLPAVQWEFFNPDSFSWDILGSTNQHFLTLENFQSALTITWFL